MILTKTPLRAIAALALIALPFACGKKSGSSDSDGDSAPSEEGGSTEEEQEQQGSIGALAISDNELAASYPEGLSISALPAEVDSKPGEAAPGTLVIASELLLQDPNNSASSQSAELKRHPKDKLKDHQDQLNGEGDCFEGIDLNNVIATGGGQQEICFQFDIGMIAGTQKGTIDKGQFNPIVASSDKTTSGILTDLQASSQFSENETSEACMVVKGREKVEERGRTLESMLGLIRGMLCQAKKDGLADSLPTGDEPLNLKSTFDAMSGNASVSTATIKRLADQGSRFVYQTDLAFSTGAQGSFNGEFTVKLVHSPAAEGNSNYQGVLQYKTTRTDDQNNETYRNLVSMIYEKTGSSLEDQRLRFEVRDASFNVDRLDESLFFAEDGRIELNPGAGSDGSFGAGSANDYSEGMGYFAFDINPSTYAGKISFWTNPGGNYQEGARGFVFNVSQQSDGKLAGCAWAGSVDYSIRKAIKEDRSLVPNGCSTPQIQTGGVCTGSQVWKQCFQQNANGIYELDSANIEDDSAGYDVLPTAPSNIPDVSLTNIESIAKPE